MRATLVVICALWLSGCGASISPAQLEPPASVLLIPPKPLADPKEGEDAIKLLMEVRRDRANLADRHRRLQKYVRTILKK